MNGKKCYLEISGCGIFRKIFNDEVHNLYRYLAVFRTRNCFDEFECGGLYERRRKKRIWGAVRKATNSIKSFEFKQKFCLNLTTELHFKDQLVNTI